MISIIIPVYNIKKYLSKTIESVLCQSYSDWELILVNDGSTDGSFEICKEYVNKDKRIRLINQNNKGVSWATYNGLKNAKGEYIAFADHDDYLLPDLFSELLSYFSEEIDISCCSRIDLYDKDIYEYQWEGIKKTFKYSGKEALENLIKPVEYNLQLPLWGRLYRKDFLEKINFEKYADLFPTIFMVDVFIMPQILLKARNICYTNKVLYIHREVVSSISRSQKLSSFYFEQIESFPLILELYQKNGFYDLYQTTLKEYMTSTLMRLYYYISIEPKKYNFVNLDEAIISKFTEYYNELISKENNFFYKVNYILFKNNRKIWVKSFGYLYFNVLKKIKILIRR